MQLCMFSLFYRAIIDMWFFNVASKSCEQFQYSGCGGNGNRFSEKTECESYCGRGGKSIGTGEETDKDTSDDAIVIEAASDEDNTNGTCPQFDGCGPLKCAVIKDEKTGCKKCACSHHGGDNAEGPVGSVSGTPSEDDDAKMKKGEKNHKFIRRHDVYRYFYTQNGFLWV